MLTLKSGETTLSSMLIETIASTLFETSLVLSKIQSMSGLPIHVGQLGIAPS